MARPDIDPAATAPTIPVREGDAAWTAAEVEQVLAFLQADLERLSREFDEASADLDALLRDTGGAGDDQADTGSRALEREQALTVVNNLRDMVHHTDLALDRLAAKDFGACESCGRPIGKARTQAFPRAVLCVECKQREERRG
jgi:DnaK suppressor protein